MEERKSHFVLVHGSCHGAWCWYKVATLLKSAGHKVTALDLAASGIHPKQVHEIQSFLDYSEPLIEFLKCLLPEEKVILVGHSYGGASISVAMERFPEQISAAVFVAAFMYGFEQSFESTIDKYSKHVDSYMESQFIFNDGPSNPPTAVLFGPKHLATKLYQLSPSEDLMLATTLVRPCPLRSGGGDQDPLDDLVVTKEKYGSVRRVYIVCEEDEVVKEELQRLMIESSPVDEVKVIPGSDYMPMFSKPLELCSCLQEIADKHV